MGPLFSCGVDVCSPGCMHFSYFLERMVFNTPLLFSSWTIRYSLVFIKKQAKMKILVGYDGSNTEKDALILAKKHAQAFNAKSVDIMTSLPGGEEPSAREMQAAESQLEYAKSVFTGDNIPCETHLIIHGKSPGEDLVDLANESNIDEIVIGVRKA
jgi:nucleotide-binding universal stress UspA family protein